MKYALLVLTTSLAIVSSGAFAQGNADACQNGYGSCMARCVTRPQSVQESCSRSCEANTDQCYTQIYGPRSPAENIPSAAAQSSAQDTDPRNARDEAPTKGKQKR